MSAAQDDVIAAGRRRLPVAPMNGHGTKLPRKQEQAISALLTCATIKAAAKKTGIAERTLRTWLADPAFQAAFQDARRRVMTLTIGRLQRATTKALTTLVKLLDSTHQPTRARAALGILSQALGNIELADVLERIEALEQAHEAGNQATFATARRDQQSERGPPG